MNKWKSDIKTELNKQMHGDKAITIEACRMLITPQSLPKEAKGWRKYMIGGIILSESEITRPDVSENGYEMWDCEIIILPKKRYFGGGKYKAYRIDQAMVSDGLKSESWESSEDF